MRLTDLLIDSNILPAEFSSGSMTYYSDCRSNNSDSLLFVFICIVLLPI